MIRLSNIAPFIMLDESLGRSDLSGSPICVNGMQVLTRAHQDGGIPLTKSGAFYRKFVTWAAEDFRWPGYEAETLYAVCKVLNEPDFLPLAIMHDLMIGARLLRHYKGVALPTTKGKAMIGDYGALQAELFDAFFLVLDYTVYDPFAVEINDVDVAHFLRVVLDRLGDWVSLSDLLSWCVPIDLIAPHRFGPLSAACYYLDGRLIRPLEWLGMIERHPNNDIRTPVEGRRYRKTPLFDRLLSFKPVQSGVRTIH